MVKHQEMQAKIIKSDLFDRSFFTPSFYLSTPIAGGFTKLILKTFPEMRDTLKTHFF